MKPNQADSPQHESSKMGRIFPSRLPTVPAEGLFQAFLTQVPVALFCKDPQGRFLFVNQRFCEDLGKEPEEILGKTDFDLFPSELASKYQADDRQVLRTQQPLETVEPHTVPTPEGPQTRYVHVLKVPLYAPNGELIGVQGVFWDETRRYEAERELRHERRLFQALLENIPDAVYFKDRQSRFVRVSKSMVHLFRQQSADQIIGKTDFDFFTEQHARQAYEDEQEIIRTGRPIVNKKEKETWPNRPPTYALTSKIPLRDETGKIIGTLGISKDITSLVQAQEELAATAKRLQQALRIKSQFLSHMSHELRTPLDVIIRSADLLLDTPQLDAKNRELVAQIRHGAETLLRLVTDILTLHRLEASQVKLHPQDFDLVDLVHGTVEFLAPLAHDKGLELICLIDPQLPRLHGDPDRIRQVLHNLIGNAIKFTEQGEITVRVEQKKTDPDQIWFRFEVEDTGPGIPEDQLHQIFQPFTQVDISSTRKHPGAGLGLAICKELVELMNGRIGVESTQGKGSKFFFELPLVLAKEQPQAHQTPPPWQGQRALIMSTNPKSRSALQHLLQSEGLKVVTTAGPLHAAIQFQQAETQGQPFQWVFLDTAGLDDSLALSRTIRLSAKTRPHVVLLTRLGEWIAPNVADRVGIWRCLIKPPSRQLLRQLLEEGTEPCPLPTRFEQQRSHPSDSSCRRQPGESDVNRDAASAPRPPRPLRRHRQRSPGGLSSATLRRCHPRLPNARTGWSGNRPANPPNRAAARSKTNLHLGPDRSYRSGPPQRLHSSRYGRYLDQTGLFGRVGPTTSNAFFSGNKTFAGHSDENFTKARGEAPSRTLATRTDPGSGKSSSPRFSFLRPQRPSFLERTG